MSVTVATQVSDGFHLSTASSFIPRLKPGGEPASWNSHTKKKDICVSFQIWKLSTPYIFCFHYRYLIPCVFSGKKDNVFCDMTDEIWRSWKVRINWVPWILNDTHFLPLKVNLNFVQTCKLHSQLHAFVTVVQSWLHAKRLSYHLHLGAQENTAPYDHITALLRLHFHSNTL